MPFPGDSRSNASPASALGRTWLAGLTVGAAGGFAALEIPPVGYMVLVAFTVPALLGRTRLAALGGLLVVFGAAWTLLLGRVAVTCRAPDCLSPGIESWVTVGVCVGVAGLALTVISALRRRGPH